MNEKRGMDQVDHGPSSKKVARDKYSHYLKMINLKKLNFDIEKICSVKLSPINVYCCLTCGKYFQGRNDRSPAFLHSVDDDHHIFVKLDTQMFYILPENIVLFEDLLTSPALIRNIRQAINPQFDIQDLQSLPLKSVDLIGGKQYMPGYIGFSTTTTSKIDHITCIIIAIAHVIPIRDYLLVLKESTGNELIDSLSILVKKMWSSHLLKSHLSPDELLSYLAINFEKLLDPKTDIRSVLVWLLNKLSVSTKEVRKVVASSCQGKIQILDDAGNKKCMPFWNLSLDLPSVSFFKDGRTVNELPRCNFENLLKAKFFRNQMSKFQIIENKLPNYLIIHYNRFDKLQINKEFPIKTRNQTIVEYPLVCNITPTHKYRLIVNIIDDVKQKLDSIDEDDENNWKAQIYNSKNDVWVEIDGIDVKEKEQELLFLNETHIQIWERIQ